MKVLVTGSSGILGSDICKQLELKGCNYIGFNSQNIKLDDFEDVKAKVIGFNPDILIHCAALTNVDLCEDERGLAYTVNVNGTQNVAMAANLVNAKMIYISSCGVYGNGKATPYIETDPTEPLNYHHFTKLEGEAKVLECCTKGIIIRPGWLFGGNLSHRKNFVEARRREALNVNELNSANDKIGSPTFTSDLAKQILHLARQDAYGVFNAVNEGCASRFDYVTEIIRNLNIKVKVNPVSSNNFQRKANMPDNECLENFNLSRSGLNIMRDWKDALKDYIDSQYRI
ncbi:NAD(P)-dependent oxidoreductase [Mucilaginibacter daejeonensis]|uniref:SDR family oxidoreductase n=1 Tax=Mucilaginibacter daejeonensis TaxID=398049 RepID=UPI001D17107B|nr:NAD(P)-dependent oxidoreductase [Mucilaginibacter daejeonensis]UEG54945.1 NAD(P)-dependent oxidoreductase [Mucilaginibacter daejeonensis]